MLTQIVAEKSRGVLTGLFDLGSSVKFMAYSITRTYAMSKVTYKISLLPMRLTLTVTVTPELHGPEFYFAGYYCLPLAGLRPRRSDEWPGQHSTAYPR